MFLPVGTARRPNYIVVTMTLAHATVLPPSSSLPPQLTMLHDSLADPVDSGVPSDGFVHGIHHDDLVVHVRGILTNPVRAKHTKSSSQTTCSLLSLGASTTLELDLVDAFAFRFTVSRSLRDGLLAATSS